MKFMKMRYFITFLVVLLILLMAFAYCPHKVKNSEVIQEANCIQTGIVEIRCQRCEKLLNEEFIHNTDHKYGAFFVKAEPDEFGPGVEVRVCEICFKEETREYFCEHQVNTEEDWNYEKYALPFESGIRYKHCLLCKTKLYENYEIPALDNNSIYIVGTDIRNSFTISSFTQSAVDSYDIVYTVETKLGQNNPFILGHNYGTLGILNQTEVGTHIYISINGVIEIYEVVVSEFAMQNAAKSDIIGQTTGTTLWDYYEEKTLHMYTCYGENRNGRWLVLAKQIF